MPATLDITMRLRAHQERDETLGGLFTALHTFADRTIKEFFGDEPDMPYPVVSMEKEAYDRRGSYTARDGYTLIHRINLNPHVLVDGEDAALTLAHEIVHMFQEHVGRPMKRNFHNAEFHERMRNYGLKTVGKNGECLGTMDDDDTWPNWLQENADLGLKDFLLPGTDAKPKRRMITHVCPDCSSRFRARRALNVMCLDCMVPFDTPDMDDDDLEEESE